MFFLLRCILWLSVVYAHLPGGGPASMNAATFFDMAKAHVDGAIRAHGSSLAATVASGGADWCKAHGDACADAVLTAMVTKTSGRNTDTLTAADRTAR